MVSNLTTSIALVVIALHQYAVSIREEEPGNLEIHSLTFHDFSNETSQLNMDKPYWQLIVENKGNGAIKSFSPEKLVLEIEKNDFKDKLVFEDLSITPDLHSRDRKVNPGDHSGIIAETDESIDEVARLKQINCRLDYDSDLSKRETEGAVKIEEGSKTHVLFNRDLTDLEIFREWQIQKNWKHKIRKSVVRIF